LFLLVWFDLLCPANEFVRRDHVFDSVFSLFLLLRRPSLFSLSLGREPCTLDPRSLVAPSRPSLSNVQKGHLRVDPPPDRRWPGQARAARGPGAGASGAQHHGVLQGLQRCDERYQGERFFVPFFACVETTLLCACTPRERERERERDAEKRGKKRKESEARISVELA